LNGNHLNKLGNLF